MDQLKLNLEVFAGTTPWVALQDCVPPFIGWWKTRRIDAPEVMPNQRRFWNGDYFSKPVVPYHDDWEMDGYKNQRCDRDVERKLEWCGLTLNPGLEYYKGPLVPTHQEDKKVAAALAARASGQDLVPTGGRRKVE